MKMLYENAKTGHRDDGYGWKMDPVSKDPFALIPKTRYELIDEISKLKQESYRDARSSQIRSTSLMESQMKCNQLRNEKEALQAKLDVLQFLCDTLKIDYKTVIAAGKKRK